MKTKKKNSKETHEFRYQRKMRKNLFYFFRLFSFTLKLFDNNRKNDVRLLTQMFCKLMQINKFYFFFSNFISVEITFHCTFIFVNVSIIICIENVKCTHKIEQKLLKNHVPVELVVLCGQMMKLV